MKQVDQILAKLDQTQRHFRPAAFIFGVIKKYGDDQAGYQAALVTYYGFVSLFPILLVLTTVAGIISRHDPDLARRVTSSVTTYFPVVGTQLESSIKNSTKSGLTVVLGLLFSLYGARGVANAFRSAANHVWHVPLDKRSGFPRSLLRSFSMIVGGGAGFILASAVNTIATQPGHGILFRVASLVLNLAILYAVFIFILRASLPLDISTRKFRTGAAICAVGLAVIQRLGSTILHNITPNGYSTLFATTLGLLAWIYLQAQIILYAIEVDTVREFKAWPRSLSGKRLTKADKAAQKRAAL